jgi:glycosyltransferase involved in cell wall biosynthesis
VPGYVIETENELVKAADLVFVDSLKILADFAPMARRVYRVQQGVNDCFFDSGSYKSSFVSQDLASVTRPIVGYVGSLHEHVDYGLLRVVAERRRDYSLVLIGPKVCESADLTKLLCMSNVYWLGPRPHTHLPAYISNFDVCIIPYLLNPFTEGVFPTKLFEYMAAGKPIVSSPLPDVLEFSTHVAIAENCEQWLEAIDRQIKYPPSKEDMISIAKSHKWDYKVNYILTHIEEIGKLKWGSRFEFCK